MLRVGPILREFGVAALTAASLMAMAASAQAATPTTPSAASKPASSAAAKKRVVSPYARAASQREHAGQAPVGHAPTMVQGMGKPRKPHAGAPTK